jgi:hypothetical protein
MCREVGSDNVQEMEVTMCRNTFLRGESNGEERGKG